MRTTLFCLCFLLLSITSCNKDPEQLQVKPVIPEVPVKAFTKVYLFGGRGAWGGGLCSFDWVMIREDSNSIVYHTHSLPAGVTITTNPVWVNIKFHDTTNFTHCWDDIIVDSLKF
jgi:hypothetical protein